MNQTPEHLSVYWIRGKGSTGRLLDWSIGVYDDWYHGFVMPGTYSPLPLERVVDMRGPIAPPADGAA